jgi:hypothetical protein
MAPVCSATYGRVERVTAAGACQMRANMIRTMSDCPACGGDRLVPLSFQVARAGAGDEERPEVVAMRPIAKCGGCGARVYLHRITQRGDPTESAPSVSQRADVANADA